jgi:hypothetical protein
VKIFVNYLRLSAFICGLFLFGCRGTRQTQNQAYYGPTEPLHVVVEKINENNSKIQTLWARGDFDAEVFNDKGKKYPLVGDAVLQYRPSRDLLMVGTKPAIGRIFTAGSNNDRYWLIVRDNDEGGTMWWGEYASVSGPDPKAMPVRPDLLLQVLGITAANPNLLQEPAPVMRFNNDADAYMLVWSIKAQDRWVAQKEIWYDRATFLPRLVVLFDPNGRIVLRAYLSQPKPIGDESDAPKIATRYQLFFPETKTKLNLTLTDVKFSSRGFPKDATFAFPNDDQLPAKVINIDAPPAQ